MSRLARIPTAVRNGWARVGGVLGRSGPGSDRADLSCELACAWRPAVGVLFCDIVGRICKRTSEMGKSKKKAETVFLVCEETGDYNYSIRRKPGGEKLKIKKFCPRLRRHTLHVEKKK